MKAHLLAAILTFNTDTIPYIQHGYYERDTLHTMQEYKQQHYKDTKQLKQADKTSGWIAVVGIVIGLFLGFGIGNITK